MFHHSTNTPLIYNPKPCWILSHWRSGSYYLSGILNTSGCFSPCFDEWLRGGFGIDEESWKRPWPKWQRIGETLTRDKMLQTLPAYLKIHPVSLYSMFSPQDREEIEYWLPGMRYILLRRKDFVATAVSFYIARHTDCWVAYTDREIERQASIEIPVIRDELIDDYKCVLSWQNQWERFLEDVPRLETYYEDIIDNPNEIDRIVDFLDIGHSRQSMQKYRNVYATKKFRHPQTGEIRQLLDTIIETGEHEL